MLETGLRVDVLMGLSTASVAGASASEGRTGLASVLQRASTVRSLIDWRDWRGPCQMCRGAWAARQDVAMHCASVALHTRREQCGGVLVVVTIEMRVVAGGAAHTRRAQGR